jgi:DDE superfamily endonuclease
LKPDDKPHRIIVEHFNVSILEHAHRGNAPRGFNIAERDVSNYRRILRRLEFHYVPKHASWLNMVEIEIGVLRGQCLDRRIDDPKRLASEIAAWERQRNAAKARINWMFATEKARTKLGPAYPDTSKES